MMPKLLRLAYVFEFLVALVAIFTAWSEIGGQDALDLMHPMWKMGFSLALAASIVMYTAALVSEDSAWTMRSARWLTAIVVIVAAMMVVTYFYALQEDNNNGSDESGNVSTLYPPAHSARMNA